MFEYNLTTWLLLFFTYSFMGWIWESSYVSIKTKKWTNRGFMSGPFLPIYGSGAIIVLFTTLPVQDSLIGIYIVGLISATILEFVVGYVTEALFKVRYWDYSYLKYQYKGYICLTSSLAWGFFSLLLVKFLNVRVVEFYSQFPMEVLTAATILILIPFTADATKSIRDAADLKKLLETMEANNETVAKLADYVDKMHVKLYEDTDELKDFFERAKKSATDEMEYSKISATVREKMLASANDIHKDIETQLASGDLTEEEKLAKQNDLKEIETLDEKLSSDEFSFKQIDIKDFKGAINLLKRNPDANHKTLKEEIKSLSKINTKSKKDDKNS